MRGWQVLVLTAVLAALAAGLSVHWMEQALGLDGLSDMAELALSAGFVLAAVAVAALLIRLRAPVGDAALRGPDSTSGLPRAYDPHKVGNDASARPWERNSMAFDAASAQAAANAWGTPPGFDAPGFVETAKRNFLTLQAAWDRADVPALRALMTDEMTAELEAQLVERELQLGGMPNTTEVLVLEAQLLGLDDLGGSWLASVEFSGLIREQPSQGPNPFREIWSMTKPKDGSAGWLVSGVQALA